MCCGDLSLDIKCILYMWLSGAQDVLCVLATNLWTLNAYCICGEVVVKV